jgi:hypothetical protein
VGGLSGSKETLKLNHRKVNLGAGKRTRFQEEEANICLAKKLPVVVGTQWADEVAGTKSIVDGADNGSCKKLKDMV